MIYLVSFASQPHFLELNGSGLFQVLLHVELQDALQVETLDHMDHPPVKTQFRYLLHLSVQKCRFLTSLKPLCIEPAICWCRVIAIAILNMYICHDFSVY